MRPLTLFWLVFATLFGVATDVLFGVDSIPAIIGVIKEGVTTALSSAENFIAITSNVFAVMGLVSLFCALKGIITMFRFLKHGVSFILFFIGVKMLLASIPVVEHFFSAHSWISLAVIITTLAFSVLLSLLIAENDELEYLREGVKELNMRSRNWSMKLKPGKP